MPIVAIADLTAFGLLLDVPAHALPPNAFSDGRHVIFRDGAVQARRGEARIFGGTTVSPYGLFPVVTVSDYFWIYAGLTSVIAVDNTLAHSNITRAAGGLYNATADTKWTGGNFNGVLVLNNANDIPQQWTPPTALTKLTSLSAWDTNHRCAVMRPFKNYLVALDVSKFGVRYPHMVKWSHPADPGAVPGSWDITDPAKDAGEFSLADSSGFCVESMSMRDINVLYKEDSTWLMQHVGGIDIFGFRKVFSSVGMLATGCGAQLPDGRHVVLGADDVVFHNGQSAQSIATGRIRQRLFNSLDATNYRRSFAVTNYEENEVWFCIPEHGADFPSVAFCWNWDTGAWSLRDFPSRPAVIVNGRVGDPSGGYAWSSDSEAWSADTSTWESRMYNPASQRMVAAVPVTSQIRAINDTYQNAGGDITSYVERKAFGVPFKQGQPPDMHSVKFLRGLRPLLTGAIGESVSVYVGVQYDLNDDVEWLAPVAYTIGSTEFVDVRTTGRLFSLKIVGVGVRWVLTGVELDVQYAGGF